MCPNFGTPKNKKNLHLEQREILSFLGVPILRHFTVVPASFSLNMTVHNDSF